MNSPDFVGIGKRIRAVRKKHQTTQDTLAELMDTSTKHISQVENAKSRFSLEKLIQFCSIFDCSLDYIVFGKENNPALEKLPEYIVDILYTNNKKELKRLSRYLDLFMDDTRN